MIPIISSANEEDLGITVALIPTHLPGVEIGHRHLPAMQVFQNGPNWGRDVFIPMDYIIGGQERLGQGWKMLMTALAAGRGISLPSLSAAGAAYAARTTGAYARIREQFGISISQVRRHRGAARPHRRHRLSARRRAAADLCRAEPGPSSRGDFRHHETARHRADADRDRRRHGHPWRQGRDRRPAELSRQPLPLGAGRHHRRGRQHPDPQSDRVRAGRDPRASLSARRDERARREPIAHKGSMPSTRRSGNMSATVLRPCSAPGAAAGAAACSRRRPMPAMRRGFYRQLSRYSSAFALCADMALLTLGGALKRKEMLSARLRRYPLRALSALGRAETLAGRGPAAGGFRRARMVHGERLQDHREPLCGNPRQPAEPLRRGDPEIPDPAVRRPRARAVRSRRAPMRAARAGAVGGARPADGRISPMSRTTAASRGWKRRSCWSPAPRTLRSRCMPRGCTTGRKR